MKRLSILLLVLGTAGMAASCGSSGGNAPIADVVDSTTEDVKEVAPELDVFTGDIAGATVETVVDSQEITLGDSVKVSCDVTLDGESVKANTEVHVKLGDGEEEVVEPGEWKPAKAGEYDVWCVVEGQEISDDSPAKVKVNLGEIKTITTKVEPKEIAAGETAKVTCIAADADGNTLETEPGIKSNPAEGVEITGQEVKGKVPGTYEIRCKAMGGPVVTPDTLTVTLGAPVNFTATATPATVGVGEPSTISCDVTDIEGNVVEVEWVVEAPADLTVDGTSVVTTKSGTFDINCAPQTKSGDEKYTPAKLVVEPGEAVGMKVYIKPAKEVYGIGDSFTVVHDLVDIYDNTVVSADIEPIVVEPDTGGVVLQQGKMDKFKFTDDGIYTFKVQALDLPYSGEATATCDSMGPVISFTFPPRAYTTTQTGPLVATGHVEDSVTTVASLTINDEPVTVDASGNFTYSTSLVHGMNMLKAKATDSWGNERESYRSVFRSSEFNPSDINNLPSALIPQSLRLWLSQEFLDDGDHSLPADDLATVVELIAENMDIASLLPQDGIPFYQGGTTTCTASISNVVYGQPHVTIQSVDLGLHLVVEIPDLGAELNIECCYPLPYEDDCCDPYYGFITASAIALDVYLFVQLDENKKVKAELGPVAVDLEGVDVDIQGLTGNMFDSLVNLMINTFKEIALQSFTESVGESLPGLVEDALSKLDQGLDFELPALIGSGPATPLKINLGFEELLCSYDGISIQVNASVVAPKTVAHQPLGALMRGGCLGTETTPFVMPKQMELSLALAVDLLNQAVYSIWNGGALTLNLSADDLASLDLAQYGLQNLELATDLNYAPFIETCGTDGKLLLQLGDALVHAKFFMMNMNWDIQMYLFLAIDVAVSVGTDETGATAIKINLGDFQVSEVEIAEMGPETRGKEGIVIGLIKDTALGQVKESLGEGIAFAIPSIDLSTLSDMLPPGVVLSVDPQQVGVDTGYVVVAGKLK